MSGIGALFSGTECSGGTPVKCLAIGLSSTVTFFVDSGAGQCLCSVSGAFSDLQPCRIEVTGVAGSLPIYGSGTANFVALDHNRKQIILRIPNCLYGRCEFNLLSVSQFNQVVGNRVDFSLNSPAMVVTAPQGIQRSSTRVPLVLEDGLFALHLEPLGEGDPRLESLPKYSITRKGKFVPSDSERAVANECVGDGISFRTPAGSNVGGLSRQPAHFLRPVFGTTIDSPSTQIL